MENKNKGISGLCNLGNTCYINSCLQLLSHTYKLNEKLDNESLYKKLDTSRKESILLTEWNQLRQMLWKQNCVIEPNRFVNIIQHENKKFIRNTSCDACEFLEFLIDAFHESLSRKTHITLDDSNDVCYQFIQTLYKDNYSDILSLFYGIQIREISDASSNQVLSTKPEQFQILKLSIPSCSTGVSIYDCLDNYFSTEMLKDDNAWFNEELNTKQDVKICYQIWKFPKILIIQLKRWITGATSKKDFTLVDIDSLQDFTINLQKYHKNRCNTYYTLYGVCNHIGDVNGGHYTAYVKNSNRWFCINDTNVSMIPKEKVICNENYLLFFHKNCN